MADGKHRSGCEIELGPSLLSVRDSLFLGFCFTLFSRFTLKWTWPCSEPCMFKTDLYLYRKSHPGSCHQGYGVLSKYLNDRASPIFSQLILQIVINRSHRNPLRFQMSTGLIGHWFILVMPDCRTCHGRMALTRRCWHGWQNGIRIYRP